MGPEEKSCRRCYKIKRWLCPPLPTAGEPDCQPAGGQKRWRFHKLRHQHTHPSQESIREHLLFQSEQADAGVGAFGPVLTLTLSSQRSKLSSRAVSGKGSSFSPKGEASLFHAGAPAEALGSGEAYACTPPHMRQVGFVVNPIQTLCQARACVQRTVPQREAAHGQQHTLAVSCTSDGSRTDCL